MKRWCNLQYQVVRCISNPPYPPTAVPGGTPYPLTHIFNICSARWNADATCSTRWYAVFPIPHIPQLQCQVVRHTPNPHLWYLQCQVERRCNLQYQVVCSISNPFISVSSVPGGALSQTAIPGGMQHSEPSHPSISAVPDGTLVSTAVPGVTQCSQSEHLTLSLVPGGTLMPTSVPGGTQFFQSPQPQALTVNWLFLFPICYSFCSAGAHTYACRSIPDGTKFCLWQVGRILCNPYLGHPVSCVHRCHQHR